MLMLRYDLENCAENSKEGKTFFSVTFQTASSHFPHYSLGKFIFLHFHFSPRFISLRNVRESESGGNEKSL